MHKGIRNFTANVIVGANVATIAVMLLVGYSDRLDPQSFPILSCLGLAFPFLVLANLAFLVFWVLFSLKRILVPLVGFAVAYGPVHTYCPLSLGGSAPADAISVMSFNVNAFHPRDMNIDMSVDYASLDYVLKEKPDIVCLQETHNIHTKMDTLRQAYASVDTAYDATGSNIMALLSRFPVVGHERIDYASKGNMSTAFFLDIDGQRLIVINNHFETTGLSKKDRSEFRNIVHGKSKADTVRTESKRLLAKLGERNAIRARQAQAVARFMERHRGVPVILCGDFNDNPISYTHHVLASRLTDCYVATGNGPGWSYTNNGMRVRIDNIMCSADFEPYACRVVPDGSMSDHRPTVSKLKMRGKTQK